MENDSITRNGSNINTLGCNEMKPGEKVNNNSSGHGSCF